MSPDVVDDTPCEARRHAGSGWSSATGWHQNDPDPVVEHGAVGVRVLRDECLGAMHVRTASGVESAQPAHDAWVDGVSCTGVMNDLGRNAHLGEATLERLASTIEPYL